MKRNGRIPMKKPTVKRDDYLHGWDDQKLYYWDGTQEFCVNDHPEFFDRLTMLCKDFFKRKKKVRIETTR